MPSFRNENAYDAIVDDAARRWGAHYGVHVPTAVVKGVIAKESSFRRRALRVEPDGRRSLGLMQVLEDTARDLGLRDPSQLYNPAVGINYGVKYLAWQLRRYDGDPSRAVSAYNAGTATTRNRAYVTKVMEYARGFGYAALGAGALVAGALILVWMLRRG